MLKTLTLFIAFAFVLLADDHVEIFATKSETQNNIIRAEGEVVVVYKDYILYAKRAIYDKNKSELELFENVRASEDGKMKFLGEYAKLNTLEKTRHFKPFFMLENNTRSWINAHEANGKENIVDTGHGVVSSCEEQNPLWKMEFSSSDYNTDSMWLNLYNARLYLYDFPVFYTPYFGYSLDTTRRTGLLPPTIGVSSGEGFYYEQPIYIAEQNWWDLELRPQIRTNRGKGLYGIFRFVDAKDSKGVLSFGQFNEKLSYMKKHDLANQKHYGFNFLYDNKNVLNNWFNLDLDGQSGLYTDITDMNDVDYLNLSKNDVTQNATSLQIISRANLFYNTDSDYFGAYAKYYKDLRYKSNDETIQNLPSFHYHRYLDTLFDDHFIYNIDFQTNNFYRKIGKNAIQSDLNIPLTLQTSLLDEYLTLGYTANLYAQHTAYSGSDKNKTKDELYESGVFARNYHSIYTSTQLSKAYEDFAHVIDMGAEYTFAGGEFEEGFYKNQGDYCKDNPTDSLCDFYNIKEIEKKLSLYFSQYFYDPSGVQRVYHKLSQSFRQDGPNRGRSELENELDWQISKDISFYNNMFYNYDRHEFSKNYNKLSYNDGTYNLAISHMRQKYYLPRKNDTSYLTSSFGYRYNQHYSMNLAYNYDLELKLKKSLEVGFMYEKRCWDFGLIYVENNRPILRSDGSSKSIYDKMVYIVMRLKPFMPKRDRESGFIYRFPQKDEADL
ncbi:MAG: LPS assembly protein LptD [Sulfurimonas sp.]